MSDYKFGKPTYAYAAGVISALWGTLLTKEQYDRLLPLEGDGLIRALSDIGYGRDTKGKTLDALTKASISSLKAMLSKTVPDEDLTNLFFIGYDAHNLKVLLKERLLGGDCSSLLVPNGVFDPELLKICVETDEYSILGKEFVPLSELSEERSPQKISTAVDNAVWAHIFAIVNEKNSPLLKTYFEMQAAYTNTLTLMRAKRLGIGKEATDSLLIPGEFPDIQTKAEDVPTLELERDKECSNFLRAHRNDPEGIAAIACFINEKINEVKNLRLIAASGQDAAGDLDI